MTPFAFFLYGIAFAASLAAVGLVVLSLACLFVYVFGLPARTPSDEPGSIPLGRHPVPPVPPRSP